MRADVRRHPPDADLFLWPTHGSLQCETVAFGNQFEDRRKIRAKLCGEDPARLFEQLLRRDLGERELTQMRERLLLVQPDPELPFAVSLPSREPRHP